MAALFPERSKSPFPGLREDLRLPPLATMVMASIANSRLETHTSESLLPTSFRALQPSSNNIKVQNQSSFPQFPDDASSSNRTAPLTNSPERHVKSHTGGFEFIQINTPSGKIGSVDESTVRSYIRRKFHENRRRRGARKGNPSLRLAPHSCSSAQSAAIISSNYGSATSYQKIPLASDKVSRSQNARTIHSNIPPRRSASRTIRFKAVCAQCGRLLLQETPNDEWSLQGGSFGSPRGLLSPASYDPFDTTALPISHKMHELFHHCKLT